MASLKIERFRGVAGVTAIVEESFDRSCRAYEHDNGEIGSAALWGSGTPLAAPKPIGPPRADLLAADRNGGRWALVSYLGGLLHTFVSQK